MLDHFATCVPGERAHGLHCRPAVTSERDTVRRELRAVASEARWLKRIATSLFVLEVIIGLGYLVVHGYVHLPL
ncbi:MAG: hypothetical protein R3B06_10850 [Kofleriaceae bacterium]